MASVTHVSSPGNETIRPTVAIPAVPGFPASATIPAREAIRMGRAAAAGLGINWLTMTVMVLFHLGALAALFFFSW